jgi:hypothetical protein
VFFDLNPADLPKFAISFDPRCRREVGGCVPGAALLSKPGKPSLPAYWGA